ncbi:inactive serine/threonine-protein kinase TEX14 isoform X2 [Ornithorhynchus anatinus]|uniref:inactive serine/threonine-protein kinase TEX14 isoform X2 n=1 Tax=Ornithorhynchus anatinus TaxID=9258 RepID=UPI0010A82AE8|nr:inactive serine/threonine-protein kinase TEX14 isoform X2 [Ornithorhynchus anatinus]
MSRAVQLPIPCPVQLGTVRSDSIEAQLHECVQQGNYIKVKKILKKRVHVDSVNSLGQTALFTAALLGLPKVVDVLLDHGADPNRRCSDGSSPVHAAAFSAHQGILSKLLDAGGDLRLHDENGRTPHAWALSAAKDQSAQVLELLERCAAQTQALVRGFPRDLLRRVDCPQRLVCPQSRFAGIVQGNPDSSENRSLHSGFVASKTIYSFGFGKFYFPGATTQPAFLSSVPVIGEKDVVQAEDESTFTFASGPHMTMTNLMWSGTRVTVKELNLSTHPNCSKLRLADLLIAEQEYSSKLRHPHLLQLMAVCLSHDLDRTRLVYERVNIGTLYSILHERRSQFPALQMEVILHLLLQMNDALRYLHTRGLIHRSLSSYAIHIVSMSEARLTNLEHAIESEDGRGPRDPTGIPLPTQLFNWAAPEVILQEAATVKSDIYSFCVIVQESLTESLPWNGVEGSVVKEAVVLGNHLEADVRLAQPYYDIVKTGTRAKPKDRSMNLQDIRYLLKNDLQDLIESQKIHSAESSNLQRCEIHLRSTSIKQKEVLRLQVEAMKGLGPRPNSPSRQSALTEEAVLCHDGMSGSRTTLRSQDASSEPERACGASLEDESLRSFEINEVFSRYLENQEEDSEGFSQSDRSRGDDENGAGDGDAASAGGPTDTSRGDPVSEGESESESAPEEAERRSPLAEPSGTWGTEGGARGGGAEKSRMEQYISKSILNLKISQALVHQATDSLRNTEWKIDRLAAVQKHTELLRSVSQSAPGRGGPRRGPSRLPEAVGPPTPEYDPPAVPSPAGRADPSRSPPKAAGQRRAARGVRLGRFGQRSGRVPEEASGERSDREFYCCAAGRQRDGTELLCYKGEDGHSVGGRSQGYVRPTVEFLPSEVYDSRIRSARDTEPQSKWTREVKEMAEKAACGQLGILPRYRPGDSTSESEMEPDTEAERQPASRAQDWADWWRRGPCRDRRNGGRDEGGASEADTEEEDEFKRPAGPRPQSPRKYESADLRAAFQESCGRSADTDKLSSEHFEKTTCSPASSDDMSDEFLTPDPSYMYPSTTRENVGKAALSLEEEEEGEEEEGEDEKEDEEEEEEEKDEEEEEEEMKEEEDMEITREICIRKETPGNPMTGGKRRRVAEGIPGDNSDPMTKLQPPAITSFEGKREETPKEEWLKERKEKEKEISFTDIQDLSSISDERDHLPKETPCKTPRTSHAPTSVSTPLSPGTDASAGHYFDDLPPPSQELLDEIAAEQSRSEDKEIEAKGKDANDLRTKEAPGAAEETERAHSTLDDDLEGWLGPTAESEESRQDRSARETSIEEPGTGETKNRTAGKGPGADGGKAGSHSGISEDGEEHRQRMWQQLGWSQPSRIIILDQSDISD